MPIPWDQRPQKFCSKCQTITPWNSGNRCLVCQRERSRRYYERKVASGGEFSEEVKARLRSEHPEKCPGCDTPWDQVEVHSKHPNTPWHFDHHVSPQHGGTNADNNARIMCWRCNLEKLNKRASTQRR